MKRTIPQVIMLNHAAWIEHENAEIRYQAKKEWDETHQEPENLDPVLEDFGNKRMSELQENEDQLMAYLTDWSKFQ